MDWYTQGIENMTVRIETERQPSRPVSAEHHHAVAQPPSVISHSDMEAFGNRLSAIVGADFYAAALAVGPVDVPLGEAYRPTVQGSLVVHTVQSHCTSAVLRVPLAFANGLCICSVLLVVQVRLEHQIMAVYQSIGKCIVPSVLHEPCCIYKGKPVSLFSDLASSCNRMHV